MGMSTATKRGLAIGVVVIVIVGAGIGAWWLIQPRYPAYETPGVTGIPYDRIIRIGVLDPMTEIQGRGCREGAWLAAYEINKAGGINVNGTIYYIGLIAEDTYEADPMLDTTKGVTAAQKIIVEDQAQFLMGGFRTESLKAYIEVVMDKKVPFIGTGASTDYFTQMVRDSYSRYKYFFRNMPINSTALGKETITELVVLRSVMGAMANTTVHKWAIIREALDWTLPMAGALKANLRAASSNQYDQLPVAEIAYPLTATSSDFAGYWSTIQAAGAQIVVPIISAQGGILMTTQYNQTQPKCLIVGIDVQSQLDSYWTDTAGKAMYEVVMQSVTRTNKTALTIPFWDHYVANFSRSPLYTAVGGYDAVYLYRYAINKTQSFINDRIVAALEKINNTNPLVGAGGTLAFQQPPWYSRNTHDLAEGWPFGVTLWVQWQSGGAKPCITSGGAIYPSWLTTGTLKLPPQGINPG